MFKPRDHQIKGAEYISSYGKGLSKGNYVSVACCVSSGKTLLATMGIAENIKNNIKTCQVFICPRLSLCKQQAEEIYDYLAENHLLASVELYNSAKYDGKRNIHVCSDRNVGDEEFFTSNSHVVIVACDESIWGGKDAEFFARKNTFEKILKNNEEYGRLNVAIIYDEAHNYESKSNIIEELSSYFNVSVLMSGTPSPFQENKHKEISTKVDYSIRNAIFDDIICKPTLNVINGYDDESYLASAINSILLNEKYLHKSPFKPRVLVCARSIDAINSVVNNVKDCHIITLHSTKTVFNDNNEIENIVPTIDGIEKSANETMKIIEELDKKENYFGDDLPIVVFQVDMISEGVNIKSFNSVLITTHSDVKQMQQIGRVLRDIKFNGHSKKDEDNVNIYAAVSNKEDLAELLIKLEEYDLTDDVFKWGKITNVCNGSSPKNDEDALAFLNVWEQIDEVLNIEEILKLRDTTFNKQKNNALSKMLEVSFTQDELDKLKALFSVVKKSSTATKNDKSSSSQKKTESNNKKTSEKKRKNNNEEKTIAEKLRQLYRHILEKTGTKIGQKLWKQNDKSLIYKSVLSGMFSSIEVDDEFISLLDKVVNVSGWRF